MSANRVNRVLRRAVAAALVGVAGLSLSLSASAQPDDGHGHGRPQIQPPPAGARRMPPGMDPRGKAPADPHGKAADPHAGHGAPDAHGGGHGAPGEHHGPGHINWAYGLLGEKDGVPPSLMYRPKGMPVPFLANLINFGVLAFLAVRFGKKPLQDGLKKRRDDLMREIDEAAKVKEEAEDRLAEYEEKMESLEDELARIKKDYAEQGKRDEERIVREAKERRARMKRDAELLLDQEGKSVQAALLAETVQRATAAAEKLVQERLSAQDHERLADEYLREVTNAKESLVSAAGGAS